MLRETKCREGKEEGEEHVQLGRRPAPPCEEGEGNAPSEHAKAEHWAQARARARTREGAGLVGSAHGHTGRVL